MANEELKAKYARIANDPSQLEMFKNDIIDGAVIPEVVGFDGEIALTATATANDYKLTVSSAGLFRIKDVDGFVYVREQVAYDDYHEIAIFMQQGRSIGTGNALAKFDVETTITVKFDAYLTGKINVTSGSQGGSTFYTVPASAMKSTTKGVYALISSNNYVGLMICEWNGAMTTTMDAIVILGTDVKKYHGLPQNTDFSIYPNESSALGTKLYQHEIKYDGGSFCKVTYVSTSSKPVTTHGNYTGMVGSAEIVYGTSYPAQYMYIHDPKEDRPMLESITVDSSNKIIATYKQFKNAGPGIMLMYTRVYNLTDGTMDSETYVEVGNFVSDTVTPL